MRYILPILGLVALVAVLAGIKFGQISTLIHMGKAMQQAGPPPEAVSTTVSRAQTWEAAVSAVGSIAAAKGVALSNDAPGVVSRILFESGALVKQGQIVLELDTNVERAQLASAKARLDLAGLTASRSRSLARTEAISRSQLDSDEAQLKTSTTDLGALQAQIDRKVVRAPFSGKLGIRAVNLGQYLSPGTTVTMLEAIDTVYADFELPQQRLADVKVGMPVRVTVDGDQELAQAGVVAAVDPEVDAATRTIRVRATVPNAEERLRPGMFVTVSVILPKRDDLTTIPSTALVHASYGDSVFVVEDRKDDAGRTVTGGDGQPGKLARQQFVRVGESRGDFVAVLDGVTPGQEVVSAGAFKLRNGSGVVVHNDVKVTPELNPHRDNR